MKRLLIVHNLRTGQDIVHEFSDSDFAFELVEADAVADEKGELDVESRLFYRLDGFLVIIAFCCLSEGWCSIIQRSIPSITT